MGFGLISRFSLYIDRILTWLNCLYVLLWGIYFAVWFAYFWSGWLPLGDLVGWFRGTFGILGFAYEAVPSGTPAVVSRFGTFFNWVFLTIWRDFVSLSLLSSILYLIQKRVRTQKL